MCDTFIATPNITQDRSLIFAKNSDREPNEAQSIVYYPSLRHRHPKAQLTYITIPQVTKTYAVILAKPFQMWGAEMGVNECGVVIGNEAVFTKIKFDKKNSGLTGMDMVRLALERCSSAKQALKLSIILLEKYGQDACGGYQDTNFYYSNSFLIADYKDAYVLETADRHWAYTQVHGFYAISNGLTIGKNYDYLSNNAQSYALKNGWYKETADFSFRDAFTDFFYTTLSQCKIRRSQNLTQGKNHHAAFTAADAMFILRTHSLPTVARQFHPATLGTGSVCMHAAGLLTPHQTVGSMVVEVRKNKPTTVWLTGTSAPCISVFKPFFFESKSLNLVTQPLSKADTSLWWQHEKIHRRVLRNYPRYLDLFIKQSRQLETQFLAEEKKIFSEIPSASKLGIFSRTALEKYYQKSALWRSRIISGKIPPLGFHPLYQRFWMKQNEACGLIL